VTSRPLSHDLLEGRAVGTPTRVRLLHLASMTVLALLVSGSIFAANAIIPAPTSTHALDTKFSAPAPVMLRDVRATDHSNTGSTAASIIVDVGRSVESIRGELVEMRLENPRSARATFGLRLILQGADPTRVARLLSGIERNGVESVKVDGLTAVPTGTRVDISGLVMLSTAPLISGASSDGTLDTSVQLAELAALAGVHLRRVDASGVGQNAPVQLRVEGELAAIAHLVGLLEADLSAPARFRTIRIERSIRPGQHVSDLTFLLRERQSRDTRVAAQRW